MALAEQSITESAALYCGDCMEVMAALPSASVGFSLYSPPFAGLYHYSSDERDLSNVRTREEFFEHYAFIVREIARLTQPGRMTAVHCTDIPTSNSGRDAIYDMSGDIIRLHEGCGWSYIARYHVWKEPFGVRMRTMAKGLAHQTLVEDSSRCSVAHADYLLVFRRDGENAAPIEHPIGLLEYAGEREVPPDIRGYRGWTGKQTENRYSHWVWRQYASAFWDDVRIDRVLPFVDARDDQDEKHVHPLQLDVIDRALVLWSNPGDVVLTPFMGVGSEVYGAVRNGRRAIGAELKSSYYKQAVKNVATATAESDAEQMPLLAGQS